jgi:hypothetical protein
MYTSMSKSQTTNSIISRQYTWCFLTNHPRQPSFLASPLVAVGAPQQGHPRYFLRCPLHLHLNCLLHSQSSRYLAPLQPQEAFWLLDVWLAGQVAFLCHVLRWQQDVLAVREGLAGELAC